MENLSATPLRAPKRGGRSITIMVVADVLNLEQDDLGLARLVVNDFVSRDEFGYDKYGQNLEARDGRPTVWDLYQELLDACQYAKKLIIEEDVPSGMEHIYYSLMALVRDTRKAIHNAYEREDAMDWGKKNDSGKEGHTQFDSEEWTRVPERDCEELRPGAVSGSSELFMDTD